MSTYQERLAKGGPLSQSEAEIVLLVRELRKKGKPCMIVVRYDGQAWQLAEALPPRRIKER